MIKAEPFLGWKLLEKKSKKIWIKTSIQTIIFMVLHFLLHVSHLLHLTVYGRKREVKSFSHCSALSQELP